MTKQEMLYEQYNDALFRLLMHSVAQHQGQQYQEENQALKAQEGGPSETAKRRCLRTISRQVRRDHARAAARTASRVLSKAAVVMLLVISCLTAAFAVSPVFRSDALRWAVATFGDHAEYRFNQTEGGVQYQGIEVGWLPEGYELVESDVTSVTMSRLYTKSDTNMEHRIKLQIYSCVCKNCSIFCQRRVFLSIFPSLIASLVWMASMSDALMTESINSMNAVDSPASLLALMAS